MIRTLNAIAFVVAAALAVALYIAKAEAKSWQITPKLWDSLLTSAPPKDHYFRPFGHSNEFARYLPQSHSKGSAVPAYSGWLPRHPKVQHFQVEPSSTQWA